MKKTTYRKLLILYVTAIWVISMIPGGVYKSPNIWSYDKILHIIVYFIFAFLAINSFKSISTKTVIIMLVIGTFYGVFNEVWQGLVPNRDANIYDAIANGIGIILGSIITLKYLLFSH